MDKKVEKRDNMQNTDPMLANQVDDNFIDIEKLVMDVIGGLARYWYLILISMIICPGLIFVYQKKSYTPSYSSSATCIIYPSTGFTTSPAYYEKYTNMVSDSFPKLISNAYIRKMIKEDLGMESIPGTISAERLSETNMFTVVCTSTNAQMSYDILQSVLKNYPRVARKVIGLTNMTMLSDSGVPQAPTNSPSYVLPVLIGAAAPLFLWCVVISLLALLKTSIQKEDDCQRLLGEGCIVSIPKVVFRRRKRKEKIPLLITERDVGYGFCESVKTLQLRVERFQEKKAARVFLFTSTLPGEGKTTIAANLALSLAETGKKVILMDMDVRNADMMSIFGKENPDKNLVDFIEAKETFETLPVATDHQNLLVVPGRSSDEPDIRIAYDPRMKMLFDEARKSADFVLVDTASVDLNSYVVEIAKYADAALYVVQYDFAPVKRIQDSMGTLSDSGISIAGIILNKVTRGNSKYVGDFASMVDGNVAVDQKTGTDNT